MRSFAVVGLLLALVVAACQPSPPTVVYIVVSPTPEDEAATSPEPAVNGGGASRPAATPTPSEQTLLPTSTFAPTPDAFPTETVAQIQVAEQVYENGRMMWLEPVGEIWVMIVENEGEGRWLRYEDTFIEGEDPEIDSSINAPEGLIQPERGFGKLWRENPDVRDALGWAVTPEFGYISQYQYIPGGTVEEEAFVSGFGEHRLFSLNGEAFTFDEESETWVLGS